MLTDYSLLLEAISKAETKVNEKLKELQAAKAELAKERRRLRSYNKKNLKDNHTKSSGDEKMRDYVLDIYLTLMTRGIYGTYIYAMDPGLREYLKTFFA